MRQVRKYYLTNSISRRHLHPILIRRDHKFESPKTILWATKSAAHGWSVWIAEESKIGGKKEVIHLL
jgi:hypothetical protein